MRSREAWPRSLIIVRSCRDRTPGRTATWKCLAAPASRSADQPVELLDLPVPGRVVVGGLLHSIDQHGAEQRFVAGELQGGNRAIQRGGRSLAALDGVLAKCPKSADILTRAKYAYVPGDHSLLPLARHSIAPCVRIQDQ